MKIGVQPGETDQERVNRAGQAVIEVLAAPIVNFAKESGGDAAPSQEAIEMDMRYIVNASRPLNSELSRKEEGDSPWVLVVEDEHNNGSPGLVFRREVCHMLATQVSGPSEPNVLEILNVGNIEFCPGYDNRLEHKT